MQRRSDAMQIFELLRQYRYTPDGTLEAALEQLPLNDEEEYEDPIQEKEEDKQGDTYDANKQKR